MLFPGTHLLFLLAAPLQHPRESVLPAPPRRPLPRPVAGAPVATVNQNRTPAGRFDRGTLTLALDVVEAAFQPEGPNDPVVRILAFAEAGKAPSVPGPMLRAPAGTTVKLTLRNRSDSALVMSGLRLSLPQGEDTLNLAPGAAREISFTLGAAGTYFYWGALKGIEDFRAREWLDSQLSGAFIVDPAGTPFGAARDRVWLVSEWFYDPDNQPFESALVFNGKAWPYNERLTFVQGDSVHFRLINTAAVEHPMHLHGFYFKVLTRGGPRADTVIAPGRQALQNMQIMQQGGTMLIGFVPTTPGNWVFHCHFASHVGDHVSLHGSPEAMTLPAAHAPVVNPHAGPPGMHQMRGLVIGMHVTPAPGYTEPAPKERRTIRLFVQKEPDRFEGGVAGFGFIMGKGDSLPPKDKIRIPAPTLELKRGEPVRIVVKNNLDEMTGVHWHGLEIESFPDGVPGFSGLAGRIMPPIAPGDSFVAEFTPPRSGTFPYHSHLEEMRQIGSGMYGAIIVSDQPRDTTREHLVVAGGGGLEIFAKGSSSPLLVNGQRVARPIVMTVGDTNRIRIVSIHADWALGFRLGGADELAQWRPLARDGADLPEALRETRAATVLMGPGETADFLYLPTKPGELELEVYQWPFGNRVVVPVIVKARKT